ncbi:MAG: AAA family ATPase [Bacilli bacterium]|nr:AAA family ATPase [Bacilli bacterium]
MGIYLNPEFVGFQESISSEIYIDKTGLLHYTNQILETKQKFICVSRPRRFGKSMAAEMLAAYYGRGYHSADLFQGLQITKETDFFTHLNQYNVIFLNMQDFLSRTHDIKKMKALLEKVLLRDLLKEYPDVDYLDKKDLIGVLFDIYHEKKEKKFIFIIDEWDCIFREMKHNLNAQTIYLDFLRNLLKDKGYVALAYMTGILPIKKYGSHSALNMFDEFSMLDPSNLAEYVGFTEQEVSMLCQKYQMDFTEMKHWYDGYHFDHKLHIYNPRSVVRAMLTRRYNNYWNQTETFEALRDYIVMNYDGLRDTIIELLAGNPKKINPGTFSNDMTTFTSADDVLTLLVHLGYLGYNFEEQKVYIPNSEIETEFINAIQNAGWEEVIQAIKVSEELLQATWDMDEVVVADKIEQVHLETSSLTYNNENSLSCTISLAYYSARKYYTMIREFPTGKGFADMVYLPRKNYLDKPAMIIELKWDKSAESAISQIKSKQYVHALKEYSGNLLLVGINYDKKEKTHSCVIERFLK